MAHCPFCETEVKEDLVVFGGTCPKCFGEVPGEEAPTDPGEDVKKQQEHADRRRLRRAMILPAIGLSMAFAGLLGVAGFLAWQKVNQPEIAVLDFDVEGLDFEIDFAKAEVEPEPVVDPVNKARSPARPTKPRPDIRNLDLSKIVGTPDTTPDSLGATGPETVDGPRGTRSSAAGDMVIDTKGPDVDTRATSGGLSGLDSIDMFGPKRKIKGVTLTDDSAIIDMLKAVMQIEMPKLGTCYEQRLKLNENLQGRWSLNFVVKADGTVMNAVAEPTGMTDPELEACLATRVSRWEFQPIKSDQPVKKSINFKPGF